MDKVDISFNQVVSLIKYYRLYMIRRRKLEHRGKCQSLP